MQAWFAKDYAPRESLERLLTISDRRLRHPVVMAEIRRLMLAESMFDEYERLLQDEMKRPGVDRIALTRQLIRFYIDTGKYQQGMDLIAGRPVDSLPDNLLYIELLIASGDEKKAMAVCRQLLGTGEESQDLHALWMQAYVHSFERTGIPLFGADETGTKYEDVARKELELVRDMPARGLSPRRLFTAIRVAGIIDAKDAARALLPQTYAVALGSDELEHLIKTAEDLGSRDMRSEAISLLESALAQKPNDLLLQRRLAENYFLDNRTQEAINLLQEVVREDPSSIRSIVLLADCYTIIGQREQALDLVLERLKDPNLNPLIERQLKAKAAQLGYGIDPSLPADAGSSDPAGTDTGNASATPADTGSDATAADGQGLSDQIDRDDPGNTGASDESSRAGGDASPE